MSTRERLERRLEKRQDWAESRSAKAASAWKAHENVPLPPWGEPIKIGHHSEHRHRNALNKSANLAFKAIEHEKMADNHAYKAAGIEAQLENSIFSDDSDAIEALQARIAEREAERDKMKLVNKLYKAKDAAGLLAIGLNLDNLTAQLVKAGPYFGSKPYLTYSFSNLGALIRADKKRIETVKHRQVLQQAAEDNGGVVIKRYDSGYCSVTFAEKPERSVINTLKAAGFYWGGGSWSGKTENLPASIN